MLPNPVESQIRFHEHYALESHNGINNWENIIIDYAATGKD